MEKQTFYKVRHKETGKFWKGGGIKNHIKNRINPDDKNDVLKEAFSNLGKAYSQKYHIKSALRHQQEFGEEPELQRILFEECEIVLYKTTLMAIEDPNDIL
ncbi:MAG: hypothetical protein ACOC22_02980 [bacterium]